MVTFPFTCSTDCPKGTLMSPGSWSPTSATCHWRCEFGHFSRVKISIHQLVGGWATPLKNMKVNWDDDIPNLWENKKWQPNHQPASELIVSIVFSDKPKSQVSSKSCPKAWGDLPRKRSTRVESCGGSRNMGAFY